MTKSRCASYVLAGLLAAALLLPADSIYAHSMSDESEQRQAAHKMPDLVAPKNATDVEELTIDDAILLDADGNEVRIKSDVLGGRIFAMDFVYTTCTTLCPILSSIFGLVQDKLGDRLGREVALVSLSIDPLTDVPARLKEYASKFNARPGWTFLTGEKTVVDDVLYRFDTYTPNFADHTPVIVVGDARQGKWRRLYGFPSPEQILEVLEAFAHSRAEATGADSDPSR